MNERATYQLISAQYNADRLTTVLGIEPDRRIDRGTPLARTEARHAMVELSATADSSDRALALLLERLGPHIDRLSSAPAKLGELGLVRLTVSSFGTDRTELRVGTGELAVVAQLGAELWMEGYLAGGDVYLVSRWSNATGEPDGEPTAVASSRERAAGIAGELVAGGSVAQVAHVTVDETDGIRPVTWFHLDGTTSMISPWG